MGGEHLAEEGPGILIALMTEQAKRAGDQELSRVLRGGVGEAKAGDAEVAGEAVEGGDLLAGEVGGD
jgi:hypothetical protein